MNVLPTKAKVYTIDNCTYKTQKDIERHKRLKMNPDVKVFHLPNAKEKSKYSRYGAHKCMINDIIFDSISEGMYYSYLLKLKRLKIIKNFERQVTFVLLEGFLHEPSGKKIRSIKYIADFIVENQDGSQTVVDVKGQKTPEFKLKEKMLLSRYPNMDFQCVQFDENKKMWRNLDDIESEKSIRRRRRNRAKTT